MKAVSKSTIESGLKSTAVPLRNVVIIYEDIDCGQHARNLVDELAHRDEQKGQPLGCHFWKFDLLESDRVGKNALTEAANSDLVVCATHGERPFSPPVKAWIEQMSEQRPRRRRVLVGLFDRTSADKDEPNSAKSILRNAAERGAMAYLTQIDAPAGDESDYTPEHLSNRAARTGAVLEGILLQRESPLHWGINE